VEARWVPFSSQIVDAWLESSDANPAAKRYVREGRADIARYLAAQAKDAG
jgi:aminopeptidase N